MRAVILAGGKGTRLHPYTVAIPKPLVRVGDYPILEIIVRQLVADGFDHLTLAVNHQAELIETFFGDGSRWKIRIDYCREEKPLGTMGPLTVVPELPEHFLVMNGDVLTDMDYRLLYDEHVKADRIFTIGSVYRRDCSEYGVLEMGADGNLIAFEEKPVRELLVSMGVYIVSRRVLPFIPRDTHFGFDNLMLRLLASGDPAAVHVHDRLWLDLGRPEDYALAAELFENNREAFIPRETDE